MSATGEEKEKSSPEPALEKWWGIRARSIRSKWQVYEICSLIVVVMIAGSIDPGRTLRHQKISARGMTEFLAGAAREFLSDYGFLPAVSKDEPAGKRRDQDTDTSAAAGWIRIIVEQF